MSCTWFPHLPGSTPTSATSCPCSSTSRLGQRVCSSPSAASTWAIRSPTTLLEIVSPGDESSEKLAFYAAHRVDEVLIIDPARRAVNWLALDGAGCRAVERSGVIEPGAPDVARQIDWS